MKVKILTEGGGKKGLGHISRCTSLYDAAERHNCKPEMYVFGDIAGVELLQNRAVISANWLEKNFLEDNISFDDYCIVDSYFADEKNLALLSKKARKVLFIDDTNRIEYPSGIVVNPALDIGDIVYPPKRGCQYYWGSDYIILRGPFVGAARKKVKKTVDKVLITMGGADVANMTPIIIREICNSHPQIKFDIVIGASYSNHAEISRLSKSNVTIHHNISAEVMRDLMLNADFAITAAGQTIYELIATRTPFVPIQTAQNQSNNINSLHELELIGDSIAAKSDGLVEALKNNFIKLLDYQTRHSLFLKFQNIIDGKGRERIIKMLTNNEQNTIDFRAVSLADCDLLYQWANDQSVRKNSFNSAKIDYESHKNWFQSKMKDDKSLLYIILSANRPIGQIRIEIEDDCGIIGYSIAAEYRGQGYGKSTLQLIIDRIKIDCKKLQRLVGRVKLDNIPSQRAFEAAGYQKKSSREYYEYQVNL